MINTNNKPVSYKLTKIFGGWRITFYNAAEMPTDAIETNRDKATSIMRAESILKMNA
jgi:hypothetical protein